jgi:hypothetical protein
LSCGFFLGVRVGLLRTRQAVSDLVDRGRERLQVGGIGIEGHVGLTGGEVDGRLPDAFLAAEHLLHSGGARPAGHALDEEIQLGVRRR